MFNSCAGAGYPVPSRLYRVREVVMSLDRACDAESPPPLPWAFTAKSPASMGGIR
jgi:hypothetical protein